MSSCIIITIKVVIVVIVIIIVNVVIVIIVNYFVIVTIILRCVLCFLLFKVDSLKLNSSRNIIFLRKVRNIS